MFLIIYKVAYVLSLRAECNEAWHPEAESPTDELYLYYLCFYVLIMLLLTPHYDNIN